MSGPTGPVVSRISLQFLLRGYKSRFTFRNLHQASWLVDQDHSSPSAANGSFAMISAPDLSALDAYNEAISGIVDWYLEDRNSKSI